MPSTTLNDGDVNVTTPALSVTVTLVPLVRSNVLEPIDVLFTSIVRHVSGFAGIVIVRSDFEVK